MKYILFSILFTLTSCSSSKKNYFKSTYISQKYEKQLDSIVVGQIESCLNQKDYIDIINKLKVINNTHIFSYSKKIDRIIIKRSYILKMEEIIKLDDLPPFVIKKSKGKLSFLINNLSLKNVIAQWINSYNQYNSKKVKSSCKHIPSSLFDGLVDDINFGNNNEIIIKE